MPYTVPGTNENKRSFDLEAEEEMSFGKTKESLEAYAVAVEKAGTDISGIYKERITPAYKRASSLTEELKTPELPETPAPPNIGKELTAFLPLLVIFAAFASKGSISPAGTAMGAMAAGLNGYHEGKQEAFQNNMKVYDVNMKKAMQAYQLNLNKLDKLLQANNYNIDAAKAEIAQIMGDLGLKNGVQSAWQSYAQGVIKAKLQGEKLLAAMEKKNAALMKAVNSMGKAVYFTRTGQQGKKEVVSVGEKDTIKQNQLIQHGYVPQEKTIGGIQRPMVLNVPLKEWTKHPPKADPKEHSNALFRTDDGRWVISDGERWLPIGEDDVNLEDYTEIKEE